MADEERPVLKERRAGFRFDKSISIGTILTIITMFWVGWKAVDSIVDSAKDTQLKTSIMWKKFVHDYPEAGSLYDDLRNNR